MKILVGYEKFSKEEAGGARISIHTLLDYLHQRNPSININVFQSHPSTLDKPPYISEIETIPLKSVPLLWWVHQIYVRKQWSNILSNKISTAEYDVAITQGKLGPATTKICQKKNIPSILFIRSLRIAGYKHYRDKKIDDYDETLSKGDLVQFPFLRWNKRQYRNAIKSANTVVANSEYTRNAIKELFGIDAKIIYPPITIDEYQTQYNPDGKITMVNPRSHIKGVDIFLDIAESLPSERFLCVGQISPESQRERAKSLSNVELWDWCNDMKKAYSQSKIVIVPTRGFESFGRIPAEAMCSGIPCVVSNRGGLPYVVGDTGEVVDDVESTSAWISATKTAEENHNPEAQIQRVKNRFSSEVQVERLEQILGELT